MTNENERLTALRAPFKPDEVKQRPVKRGSKAMLDYVSIDATINRLLDVLGMEWSFDLTSTTVTPMVSGDGEDTKVEYLAVVSGHLAVDGETHGGVGADVATDPDKAVKTALAEALKKAGHQLGIGLYLWDADERALLAEQRLAVTGDLNALKRLARDEAVKRGADPKKAESIADALGVAPADLNDADTLAQVLGLAA